MSLTEKTVTGCCKRIAFLGGAFDPPHLGHAMLAEMVLARDLSDLVLWVPSWAPPHKNSGCMTEFFHRVKMVELAISNISGCQVSDIEERKKFDPSYSYKILTELQKEYPESRLQLLIGQDSLEQLHTWYCAKELVQKFEIIAFPRKNDSGSCDGLILPEDFWGRVLAEKLRKSLQRGDYVEISSTELRKKLAKNENLHNIINADVFRYIRENALYQVK